MDVAHSTLSIPLVKDYEVNAARLQLPGQCDQVLKRAAQAIKLGDDQLVTVTRDPQRLLESGAAGE
jgi:hypothetical protein